MFNVEMLVLHFLPVAEGQLVVVVLPPGEPSFTITWRVTGSAGVVCVPCLRVQVRWTTVTMRTARRTRG